MNGRISGVDGAGRELDARVAEAVFGWRWWRPQLERDPEFRVLVSPERWDFANETPADTPEEDVWQDPRCWSYTTAAGPHQFVAHFSTDIAAAWEAFTSRTLTDAEWLPFIESGPGLDEPIEWEVGFSHHAYDACIEHVADAADVPAAICRQSLAAAAICSAPLPEKHLSKAAPQEVGE